MIWVGRGHTLAAGGNHRKGDDAVAPSLMLQREEEKERQMKNGTE